MGRHELGECRDCGLVHRLFREVRIKRKLELVKRDCALCGKELRPMRGDERE